MERITGTVSRVKGQGFQLDGGEPWYNVSKFAEGVAVPAVGASVALELDGKGFVRRVEQTGAPAPAPAGGDREKRVTRLAVLNTAATILGAGPGHAVDPAEVAALAARLERWVLREG